MALVWFAIANLFSQQQLHNCWLRAAFPPWIELITWAPVNPTWEPTVCTALWIEFTPF
jgi:hypothetical protein